MSSRRPLLQRKVAPATSYLNEQLKDSRLDHEREINKYIASYERFLAKKQLEIKEEGNKIERIGLLIKQNELTGVSVTFLF